MKCHNESLFSLQKMNRFNIIYFKLSMHKKLIYNKIEHVQPDKDVMLIKKKKDKAVVLKWNIGAPRQNKAQVLWRGSYHQVIYLGQKLSSFIKNIWFFFVCVCIQWYKLPFISVKPEITLNTCPLWIEIEV